MFLKGYEHSGLDYQNAPRDIKLYGSNNETNWVLLKTETDLPIDSITSNSTYININATEHYKYIRLQITKTYRRLASYTRISELEYYGHEEGSGSLDTTLKSVYNVPATTGTQLEVYYDGRETSSYPGSGTTVTDLALPANNGTLNGGVGFDTEYKAFTFDGTDDYISATYPSVAGDNIITMSAWILATGTGSGGSAATALYLGNSYGSNSIGIDIYDNGTVYWYMAGGSYILFNSPKVPLNVKNQWFHVTGTYQTINSVIEMKFYVNGEDVSSYGTFVSNGSLSLVGNDTLYIGKRAGVTTINWNGSIANFRLYSKALNAGQVQELYDYQKDYFLGSRSSVTLYKGHLGVGVTEPSSQLELAGDARIQEYPPRGMTNFDTYIEGHGVFCASVSSYYTPGGSSFTPFSAFDHNSVSRWATLDTSGYTSGAYTGSDNFTTNGGYVGEWIQLEVPYPIKLRHVSINPGNYASSRSIRAGYILGSTNGVEWNVITNFSGITYSDDTFTTIEAPATSAFRYFRMVVTNVQSTGTMVDITEIKYFGTPGPTILDKGSLTLGRSLDVPRISRYDVDTETPRPEKLVLDFDTTVNSSPTDISGKGNHGTFVNGASYSPADKAFSFDGTNGNITATVTDATGDWVHSTSYWFKLNTLTNGDYFHLITGDSSNPFGTLIYFTNKFTITAYSSEVYADTSIEIDRWYHVVVVYRGGGLSVTNTDIYLDGIKETIAGSTVHTPELTGTLYVGGKGSSDGFDGQLSNFKLYNVALEPSEVQKLYRLGRTGRSMVISDTAVGIGKVPEAQLDVRGNLNVDGVIKSNSPAFSAYEYDDYAVTAAGYITLGNTFVNRGGCYDTSTGKFTAPITGTYYFNAGCPVRASGGSGFSTWTFHINDVNFNPTSTSRPIVYQRIDTGTDHQSTSGSLMVTLNAGDTFRVKADTVPSPTDQNWGNGYGRFMGYLIS